MGSSQSSEVKDVLSQPSSTPTLSESYKAKAEAVMAQARENNKARKELLMAQTRAHEYDSACSNLTRRYKVTVYSVEEPHAPGLDLSSHATLESAISLIDYENEELPGPRVVISPSLPSSSLAQSGIDVLTSSFYSQGFRFVIHDSDTNTYFEWRSKGHVVPITA